ncbi:MAG: hypothetical protein JST54_08565 [Deltaproteobacteria bacterium]|nr:hypothetical protein [Deltaproteobacteria bacterium]
MLLGRIAAGPGPDFLPGALNRALRLLGEPGSCGTFRVAQAELGTALQGLRALGFRGVALAGPLQVEAARLCACRGEAARRLGRASVITFDAEGARGDALMPAAIQAVAGAAVAAPERAVVLGLGLGADAAVVALASLGARQITVAADDRMEAARLVARLEPACPGASLRVLEAGAPLQGELAVHADDGVSALRLGLPRADQLGYAIDLQCPGSGEPAWLAAFRAEGGRGEDGVGVLVRSAMAMLEQWRCSPIPTQLEARVRAAVRAGGARAVALSAA